MIEVRCQMGQPSTSHHGSRTQCRLKVGLDVVVPVEKGPLIQDRRRIPADAVGRPFELLL
jgi:hypothetical protein